MYQLEADTRMRKRNKRQYGCAFVLGRFQGFHLGHCAIVDRALSVAEHVVVLIGSSDKSGTEANPFTYEFRRSMIEAVYGDKVSIYPLPDAGLGNVPEWGDYMFSRCAEYGFTPDCCVMGAETKCDTWFLHHPDLHIITLDRSEINISATALRSAIVSDDRETFERFTDSRLQPFYEDMRSVLIGITH